MGIGNVPAVLGAALVAGDSAAISLVRTDGMTQGTQIFNVDLGAYFQLLASSEALSDTVLAVYGTTDARWIEVGGEGGFVTLAELASTTVDSGATLIGVNSNSGMFSEPSLQGVLEEDVVIKSVLAATDGTGGASLVGLQDVAAKYAGTTVEAALANLTSTTSGQGASIVGINDTGGIITATNVETALQEIFTSNALKLVTANPIFTGVMKSTSGGSAAAPVYAYTGVGGQYGMWFDGSNRVCISRAGAEIVHFDAGVIRMSASNGNLELAGDTSFGRDSGGGYATVFNGLGLKVSTGISAWGHSIPASQATGGSATAGAVYTATEQGMLQKAYDVLRACGFLT